MVKHIVMWKLKEEAEGRNKAENAKAIKEALEALNGEIDGLEEIEVGIDISNTELSADIALYSEFESKAALENYQDDPRHKAIKPLVGKATKERRMVDYEV